MQKFLAQPQIVIVTPTVSTTKHYAELQLFCQQRGKALSQNDIWIAALAQEAGDLLVTSAVERCNSTYSATLADSA